MNYCQRCGAALSRSGGCPGQVRGLGRVTHDPTSGPYCGKCGTSGEHRCIHEPCPRCQGSRQILTGSGGNFYREPCPDCRPKPLTPDLGRIINYAFTEIVFDGTDAPFEEALAEFRRNNPSVVILAMHPKSRAALVFFGQEGLMDDDDVSIPVEWRHELGTSWKWRELKQMLEGRTDA